MEDIGPRFAIRFAKGNAALMRPLGMGPSKSYAEIDTESVRVRMGWAFTVAIPRSSIAEVQRKPYVWWAYGVHGWRGRWVVNGSGHNIVALRLEPPARARILGVVVPLRELWVSLEDPDGFEAALR